MINAEMPAPKSSTRALLRTLPTAPPPTRHGELTTRSVWVWPDAQPWDMLGFVLVAIVVVIVNRRAMLTRGAGATEVLVGEARS